MNFSDYRYLKQDDVYVHADEHGAATTIVKNHRPGLPVSPVSLGQAGAAAVCRSKAWASNVTTAAWWVHAHQVLCPRLERTFLC